MSGKLKAELLEHQNEGVEFALKNPYHLNGDEMGLGKTVQALAVACKLGVPTLAVVPAYLRNNWLKEIDKFTEGLNITVISYNGLGKLLASDEGLIDYKFIVADEAQYLKNIKAKRTENFHSLVLKVRPSNLMLMSGTPIKNRVSEFWSLMQLCYYGGNYPLFKPYYKLFYKFCHKFSYERTFEINGIPIVRFEGVKNIPELKKLVNQIYIRRRSEEVLDLPEVTHTNIRCKNLKKYDKQLREAFERFEADASDPAYMTLKSANALAKTSDTINLASDMLEQDKKIVIFTCHVESAKEIAKKLKTVYIDGSVDVDKRQGIIDTFNASEKGGALVATIGSASTGYNLTSANYMIFNDLPFVPADVEQARKRIHRIGQKNRCFYYYIFSSELDEELFEMINRKTRDISKVYE